MKAQANEGSDKFVAANAYERVLTTSTVETNNGGNEVGMKALKGYFDNLAAASINKKSVLKQLPTDKCKLVTTNKEWVVMVKTIVKRD